ncbi:alpha-1,6-glucosidase domain-containing protein [Rheinheimera gaetbuli]
MFALSFTQPAWRAALLLLGALLSGCGGSSDSTPTTPDCPAGQAYDNQQQRCVASNTAPQITSAASLNLSAEQSNDAVVYNATATDAQGDSISWQLTDSKAIFSINSQSGAISVTNSNNLLAAAGSNYSITLRATDSKGAASSLHLQVYIADAVSGSGPSVVPTASQAVIYYYRQDGNYDGWILHAWNNTTCNAYADLADDEGTDWNTGLTADGVDDNYGAYWLFDTKAGASCANFIVHSGDNKDPDDNDQQLTFSTARWAFVVSGVGIFTDPDDVVFEPGFSISDAAGHWLDAQTLLWNQDYADVRLLASSDAQLDDSFTADLTLPLSPTSLTQNQRDRVPHLANWQAYSLNASASQLAQLLTSQLVIAAFDAEQQPLSASYVQNAKALDSIFTSGANDADEQTLGLSYSADAINVAVWAPTAQQLQLKVFNADKSAFASYPMQQASHGIWHYAAPLSADRKYYQFDVTAYHPLTKRVEVMTATDPYSVNTSANGRYSQFVNLNDAGLFPAGWHGRLVPEIAAAEDAVILEAHLRDLTILDSSTSAANRGKYLAVTEDGSAARQYLQRVADAGVTHFQMLPANDIATIDERSAEQINLQSTVGQLCQRVPAAAVCSSVSGGSTLLDAFNGFDPASTAAADLTQALRGIDGFNWGYDPHHFNVVEGSYASDPDSVARIVEFRQMVQTLQSIGLRVVLDVVYNHTSSAGLFDNSVFDKLVPGYYHRYNEVSGEMERSTCCENTATEHNMMAKFIVESLVHWADAYGLDGFRFDIMGHLPAQLLLDARAAVAQVDPDTYFYGEGWNFGEVANNRLFQQATQANLVGSEIGTFNDRPRDTLRDAALSQTNVNLQNADHIRLGLAGTLRNYVLQDKDGQRREGFRFSQSAYAGDPADIINYVDKHDNETLWDKLQYALPDNMPTHDRRRVHNLTAAIPLLSQGIPFFQLGVDLLRSKSLDRNSYDSGDWFNRVLYDGSSNNWNIGLPLPQDNPDQTRIAALSANSNIAVDSNIIATARDVFAEYLQIRRDSPLLRLRTADEVIARLGFYNTGPAQTAGVIVMSLDDGIGLADLDPAVDAMLIIINGTANDINHSITAANGFELHAVQQQSADSRIRQATVANNQFSVPAYTAAVFVKPQQGAQGTGLSADPDRFSSPYGDAVLYSRGFAADNSAMQYDNMGRYSLSLTLQAGNYQFDISDKDSLTLGVAELNIAAGSIALGNAGNLFTVQLSTAGNYQLSLDVTQATPQLSLTLNNTLVDCAVPDSGDAAPFNIAGSGQLYVRGSHSGWNAMPDYRLRYKGNNKYQVVADFDGEFEFKLASDDGSWTTQLWVQDDNGNIDTSSLMPGVSYPVAYKDAGTSNNRSALSAGSYSFTLQLDSANPAQGNAVGSLQIDQCSQP